MILTIILTVYFTLSIQCCVKEYADENSRTFNEMALLFLFSPIVIISDIVHYWDEEGRRWKEHHKKYPKEK
jgi:hypothetical protein